MISRHNRLCREQFDDPKIEASTPHVIAFVKYLILKSRFSCNMLICICSAVQSTEGGSVSSKKKHRRRTAQKFLRAVFEVQEYFIEKGRGETCKVHLKFT